MPRRKKLPSIPDITNMGKEPEKHIVQKSNPLMSLSETGLTLAEFKILDVYLARIDSHKPEERFIRLEKGEIEKYLGLSKINTHDLEKRIDNLFQVVTIRDKNKANGFVKIALFEKAVCYQDEDGLWQIDLGASESAMEYIFNVENIGYLRYRLRNIVNLTSRYSYILYLYLERNRHLHLSWEVRLDDLKSLLRCTAERYNQFKFFNSEVLKKCHKELNEKTECHFSYSPIRKGRNVAFIRFSLEPLTSTLPGEEQETVGDVKDIDADDPQELLAEACKNEFSREEMEVIFNVICEKNILADVDGIEAARYRYLSKKYALLNLEASKKKISNRFKYFLAMLEKE